MTGHEFEGLHVPLQELCGAPGAVLMIDTVETIAATAFREPFVGAWIHCRRRRHAAMETRVEDGHLGNVAQHPFYDFNAFQFDTIVERCECGDARNSVLHGRCDADRFFVALAAVNDPM